MKMTQEHQTHLAIAIQNVLEKSVDGLSNIYRAKGLSHKRFRWDLLWAAVPSQWLCDNLYPYLDDSHVDTALRSIVAPYSNPSKFDTVTN